ncbi:aa3-type cytochrome c oxidase subunit IV [Bauldia sp.]
MAEQDTNEVGTDYADHVRMYDGFISITKWATGAVVVVLILMAFFLL